MKQGHFYLQHQAARKSEQESIGKVLSTVQGTQKLLIQCQPWLVKKMEGQGRSGLVQGHITQGKLPCAVLCISL